MLTISIQNAKSPSYVTISATPFRWGVANRLTVVTVFPDLSVPGNDNFGNDSLGEGACALPLFARLTTPGKGTIIKTKGTLSADG